MTTSTSLRDSALELAISRSWPVLPLKVRGKVPLTPHGCKDASTDPEAVLSWWEKCPAANIGIATGALVVIDIDGPQGESTWSGLIGKHGPLPVTLESRTGNGHHLFFTSDGHEVRNDTGTKLGPGIDIRGRGGYVVAPPSVHPTGRRYTWANDCPVAAMPSWLASKLSRPASQITSATDMGDRIPKGERNSTLASLAGTMRSRGMSQRAISAALLAHNEDFCDPPLGRDEVKRVATNIAKYRPNPSNKMSNMIILPSTGNEHVTITDTAVALFSRIAPTNTLFIRGDAVMGITKNDKGTSALKIISPSASRSQFESYGPLTAWRTGRDGKHILKPTLLSADMALAFLESEQARALLPTITALINCPVITCVNGNVEIVGRGYHPDTQMFITGGRTPPLVELPEAITLLRELVSEYDFQTPGDRSRALASFITPALKLGGHLDRNIPVDVAEADDSQSGKTYRQILVAATYNEKVSMVAPREGGVGSVDESLAQQLIEGRPFIQLDNFRGKLNSPYIEALLTADGLVPVRVPHSREVKIDPARFFVMMSSNGVETTRDFANRSSIVRIRKHAKGYKFRVYTEGDKKFDLLDHVRRHQPLYLGAVFAIVRAWIELGTPRMDDTQHDFREWAGVLDFIVQHILEEAPLMEGHLIAQERVSSPDQTFLRKLSLVIARQERLGEWFNASELYEIAEGDAIDVPGLHKPDEDHGMRVIGLIMARTFKVDDYTEVEDFGITRREIRTLREDGKGYMTQKTYKFGKATQ